MPVILGTISLWPIDRPFGSRVAEAIQRAASICPDGETWRVSIYEGPEIKGTQITVRGPQQKLNLWLEWNEEPSTNGDHVYTSVFQPLGSSGEGSWIEEILEDRLRRFFTTH